MTEQRVIPCQSYYRIGFLSNTSSSHLHTHKTLNMGYGQLILTQFSIYLHHIIKITQVSDTLGKIISLPMRYTTAYKYMSYTLLYISNNTSQLGVMFISDTLASQSTSFPRSTYVCVYQPMQNNSTQENQPTRLRSFSYYQTLFITLNIFPYSL